MTNSGALNSATDRDAQMWLIELSANGRSKATLDLYRTAVNQLSAIVAKPLKDVDRHDAHAFMEAARERWTEGGIRTRLKAIKSFYGWLIEEDEIAKSPFAKISVRQPNDVQPTATDAQVKAMLKGATRQETAIVLMFAETGMRKDECSNLELADIDLAGKFVHIRISKSKPRILVMSNALALAVGRWVRQRGDTAGPLWITPREAADQYSWMRVVLANRSGNTVTSHALRRRFAINWLLAGNGENSLKHSMGWTDTKMVATYVRAAEEQIAHREARQLLNGTDSLSAQIRHEMKTRNAKVTQLRRVK